MLQLELWQLSYVWMMRKLILSLLFLICSNFSSFCQTPNHISFGKEQFANTDIYSIIYSEDDRLIVATNRGVWQYSYAKEKEGFEKFPTLPKQKSNSFFDLKNSHDGIIYCKNLKNQIFRIIDGRIELYYELSPEDQRNDFYYFVDDNGDLIIFGSRIIRLNSNREMTVLFDPKINSSFSSEIKFYNVNKSSDGIISATSFKDGKLFMISYFKGKVTEKIFQSVDWFQDKLPDIHLRIKRFNVGDDTIFVSDEMNVGATTKLPHVQLELNGFQRCYQFGNSIIALDESKGYRIISLEGDTLRSTPKLFSQTFISSSFSDEQGTLFLGTFGEGVIVVPQTNSLQHITNHLILDFDVTKDNTVFLSTREGDILKFKNGDFSVEQKLKTNTDFIITHPFSYSFSNTSFFTDVVPKIKGLSRTKDAFPTKEGVYVATNNGINFVADEGYLSSLPSFFKRIEKANNNIFHLFGDHRFHVITQDENAKTIYFADGENLFCMTPDGETSILKFNNNSIQCSDALVWNDQLIAGTPNQGLLFFKNGKVVNTLKASENGLISNQIEKIQEKNNELFIQSDRGIQSVDLQMGKMKFVGFKEGLTTSLISDFVVTDDKLWIQEKHKIYAINLYELLDQELAIEFSIDSVLIAGEERVSESEFELSHNQQSLQIFLNYRDVLRIEEAFYEYKMNDGDWLRIPAKQGKLELNNLKQESYNLEIRLRYRNELSPAHYLNFSIQAPVWLRWWFYPSTLLLLSFLMITFYRRKLKKQELHAQRINELNNSKMTALKSQMNPHFVFNALNSIQYLVLKGSKEVAYSYITQFAKLVRQTLDYSNKETILLQDEINLLRIYLELEKLRFQKDFDYSIEAVEIPKIFIPPMLIQPFIENALLHGLLHKEGRKQLSLIFKISGDSLICLIEDNGVGRAEAKHIRDRQRGSHKSFALSAIENRFRILQQSYHGDIGFKYEDFEPNNSMDVVTRVRLKIPLVSD